MSAGSVGGASISSDDSASLKEEEEEATDYVFRIVTSFRPDNIRKYSDVISCNIIVSLSSFLKSRFYCEK